jgi:CDP-6-deoxy-D-xylo-4-hexulose-3-dehydrase
MIKLAEATIDKKDIDELRAWLGTYPRLTKGPLTLEFEEKWSDYLGVKYSTFVNSGSSANLVMLATLLEAGKLEVGDSVIVPALSWATDVSPVIQLGLKPVLCDTNLEDFSCDLEEFESKMGEVKAAILVPVLGYVPNMKKIVDICEKHNVVLLEDCCESLGSEYEGSKLGTFGAMSTFSTYFGHHISTIEGGMVCTSNTEYDDILKSIRSHGWSRDWSVKKQKEINKEWGVSEFDSLYTFYHSGFNVRSTDLQAFLGIRQLDKLEEINEARNKNFNLYLKYLGKPVPEDSGIFISNFAFPIVSKNRNKIVKILKENGVEVRPLICGSLGKQPFYIKKYGAKDLPNADYLRKYGMYLPNHHLLSEEDIRFVCELIVGLV